jgi:hypothetical protein
VLPGNLKAVLCATGPGRRPGPPRCQGRGGGAGVSSAGGRQGGPVQGWQRRGRVSSQCHGDQGAPASERGRGGGGSAAAAAAAAATAAALSHRAANWPADLESNHQLRAARGLPRRAACLAVPPPPGPAARQRRGGRGRSRPSSRVRPGRRFRWRKAGAGGVPRYGGCSGHGRGVEAPQRPPPCGWRGGARGEGQQPPRGAAITGGNSESAAGGSWAGPATARGGRAGTQACCCAGSGTSSGVQQGAAGCSGMGGGLKRRARPGGALCRSWAA